MSRGKVFVGLFGVGLVMGWQLMRAAGDRANKHEAEELELANGLLQDLEDFNKGLRELRAREYLIADNPMEFMLKLRDGRAILERIESKSAGKMRSEVRAAYEDINTLMGRAQDVLDRKKELDHLTDKALSKDSVGDRVTAVKDKRSKVVQIARVPEEV